MIKYLLGPEQEGPEQGEVQAKLTEVEASEQAEGGAAEANGASWAGRFGGREEGSLDLPERPRRFY